MRSKMKSFPSSVMVNGLPKRSIKRDRNRKFTAASAFTRNVLLDPGGAAKSSVSLGKPCIAAKAATRLRCDFCPC